RPRWTIEGLLRTSAEYLSEKGIENPRLNAELLLSKALNLSRLKLYLDLKRPLTEQEASDFRILIKRRLKREPLQYILGTAPFYTVQLKVGPGVLIPRPETELLVDTILKEIRSGKFGIGPILCLDIGTGSGCIAISVLKESKDTLFVATDISDAALSYARENASSEGVSDRLDLRQGDLFEPIGRWEHFAIIVSNPPYVREDQWEMLQPEIREFEPKVALTAGPDGLSIVRRIVREGIDYMKEGGLLLLEIAPSQAKEVSHMMEEAGLKDIRLLKDLSGAHRAVLGYK
ncbi:MAG: peptide chain release factor N(5)-glutamine methyltransferase, partial [Desulfatiglandales bacterium]